MVGIQRNLALPAVCLLLFVLFPLSHCHIGDCVPDGHQHQEKACLDAISNASLGGPCCELHEDGRSRTDGHYPHFLLDDQGAAQKSRQNVQGHFPRVAVLSAAMFFIAEARPVFLANESVKNDASPDGFSRRFSGLAPPAA